LCVLYKIKMNAILNSLYIFIANLMKTLTTKEVARLCRVSDATVKRWEESGLILSERTNGGHRRFRADEVCRFQREQNLGVKVTHGDESVLRATARRRENKNHSTCSLFQALIAGCEEEAANFLLAKYLQGETLAQIFDKFLAPAMRKIGELWYIGEISVAQEHIATRAAMNAMYKLRSVLSVTKERKGFIMCCGIEGDFHELSPYLVQIIFEHLGWEVVNFGANTPLYSICDEILHHSPETICISATTILDIERTTRDYQDFRNRISKLKIPMIIGGLAFADERIRQRFPAELYGTSFTQVVEFAKNLVKK
jgi:MerR family transcriptional regulator, light-induced transcriptional regulator